MAVTTIADALAHRYRRERSLGAGGMATVYLAEDVRHRRIVAIKVLHPELGVVLRDERFLKEIELTKDSRAHERTAQSNQARLGVQSGAAAARMMQR